MTLQDRVFVEGIKFHGFHGLTRMEREIGVRLSVDVYLETNLDRACRTDKVRYTIDYRRVHQLVIEVGRGPSHYLLESYAGSVLEALFKEFSGIERITIRVRKETPVLDGVVDSVGVEISRGRDGAAP